MLIEAGGFLLRVIFDFYLTLLVLRFCLQWVGARYHNPISQFTLKLTEPLLKPLRKLIPSLQGIDLATLTLLFLLSIIKNALLIGLENQTLPYPMGLLLLALANLLALVLSLFFFAILIRVLLSWINPHSYNPLLEIIERITEPLLAPARRFIPSVSGIDLSPLVVIVLLQLINLVFIERLLLFAKGLAVLG